MRAVNTLPIRAMARRMSCRRRSIPAIGSSANKFFSV